MCLVPVTGRGSRWCGEQQTGGGEYEGGGGAMHAVGGGFGAVVADHDDRVANRDEGGGQHEPAEHVGVAGGDEMGLLTELLSYELPENQAWRAVAIEAPPGRGAPA